MTKEGRWLRIDAHLYLHDVFVQFFDAKIAGPREVYERVSPEVWNLWQTRGQPR